MTMVDDSRTNYDMSHLIYDVQNHNPSPSINPSTTIGNDETTVSKIQDTYSKLTNKFNPNTFRLNSDSQQVLYSFAKPTKNPNYADANGIIGYNGDVLYAAMGAGIDNWKDTWYCDPEEEDGELINGNFHIVKPKDTPVALDMMVINKKVNDSSKKQAIYDVLEHTVLDGCNLPSENDDEQDEP
jgi:spermidine/putrescine transport system substrate-binding protein